MFCPPANVSVPITSSVDTEALPRRLNAALFSDTVPVSGSRSGKCVPVSSSVRVAPNPTAWLPVLPIAPWLNSRTSPALIENTPVYGLVAVSVRVPLLFFVNAAAPITGPLSVALNPLVLIPPALRMWIVRPVVQSARRSIPSDDVPLLIWIVWALPKAASLRMPTWPKFRKKSPWKVFVPFSSYTLPALTVRFEFETT